MINIIPRPHQREILDYTGGTMGISAVPGSGKTWTLSALAARLIQEGYLDPGQEILVVTLTNSAVDNFSTRINGFLDSSNFHHLIPPYRVRTLHGLAHDIVRERPDLAGLDSNFTIIDEQAANQIRNHIASAWLATNPYILDDFLSQELDEDRMDWVRRQPLSKLVQAITLGFIRTAKDMQLTPAQLQDRLDKLPVRLPLAEMGAALYTGYQRALAYRAAVDFDDLIRLALQALETDPTLLERLQNRWPYILEDEAQDSSRLQEKILENLASASGNWVRVGDPNQAIFESFTTANPNYLRNFMKSCRSPQELPNSGRSTQSIIDLANHLIDWTRSSHPIQDAREALDLPHIEPAPPGDPQPNPEDRPEGIQLLRSKFTSQGEVQAVAKSLARWVPDHPDETVAVLVPRNDRGETLTRVLKEMGLKVNESLLRSTTSTRQTAGVLGNLLRYLGDPGNSRYLATVYRVWRRQDQDNPESGPQVKVISDLLEVCPRVEDYVWPRPGQDWLETLDFNDNPDVLDSLQLFREYLRRWQGTVLLPANQVVLTLAQDLFDEPHELALVHKLAQLLRQAENNNPDWRFPELAGELAVIARNERRFLGFSRDDTGFDPENYKGQVVVATIHKAKGLEWDRVYLMSVNNYDFPSGQINDRYYPEKWFIRASQEHEAEMVPKVNLNLEAETLAQLAVACETEAHAWYQEGAATYLARIDYVRERLRLFYVGITRARKELVVTWNTGRRNDLSPAESFKELQTWWETQTYA
jgi:DNA helicase-2/ATP-dependent DNA helicase PcrA